MKEAQLFGKLLPTHPDILPILEGIRDKYQIPEISSHDDSLKEWLKYGLEIDWEVVHSEILEKVKGKELLPQKARKAYDSWYKIKTIGLVDPELSKLSQEFRDNLDKLIGLFIQQFEPVMGGIDNVYQELAN